MTTCSECERPVKGLGYCDKHYQRFRTYGDPNFVKMRRASSFSIDERVAAKCHAEPVDFSDALVRLESGSAPCRVYDGERNKRGYARLRVNGKKVVAHRALYEEVYGAISDELVVDHLCRNRACCEITHLEPVTLSENSTRGLTVVLSPTCGNGHEYTVENTYWNSGKRYCKRCKANYAMRRRSAKHLAAAAA